MSQGENKYTKSFLGKRIDALAREFLTRRPDVTVMPFELGGIDYYVSVQPPEGDAPQGLFGFGVVTLGTAHRISGESMASRLAKDMWSDRRKSLGKHAYFLPVVFLLFSMFSDKGFYGWIAEPSEDDDGSPKLVRPDVLRCEVIGRESLDEIVAQVNDWYTRLAPVILKAE
jgi:hypothetical protein